jgi:hypothetical protein
MWFIKVVKKSVGVLLGYVLIDAKEEILQLFLCDAVCTQVVFK